MTNLYYTLFRNLNSERLRRLLLTYITKHEGGQAYSRTLRRIFKDFYKIEVGYGSYGGCFNRANMRPNIRIGNYCSFAGNVKIFRANHPVSEFTTHPLLYDARFGCVSQIENPDFNNNLTYSPLTIGHDVWIGENTIILPRVKVIGQGAVIGGGSIVTQDVPPYAIVAGNPARLIRYRFTEKIIRQLEDTGWWTFDKEELARNLPRLKKITAGEF